MNVKDMDPRIAAAVMRRQQEIGMEHISRVVTEQLRKQDLPELLIKKIVNHCRKIMQDSLPRQDAIMCDLEEGRVNFDDTALTLLKFGMELSEQSATGITEIMQEIIESGELDEHYEEFEKQKAVEDGTG